MRRINRHRINRNVDIAAESLGAPIPWLLESFGPPPPLTSRVWIMPDDQATVVKPDDTGPRAVSAFERSMSTIFILGIVIFLTWAMLTIVSGIEGRHAFSGQPAATSEPASESIAPITGVPHAWM